MELPIVSRNGVDLAGVNGNDVTRVGNIGIIFYVNGCGSRNNIQKFSFVMPIGSIIVFNRTIIDENATTDVILLISAGFKKYIRHNKHLSSNMVTYKKENVNIIFVFFYNIDDLHLITKTFFSIGYILRSKVGITELCYELTDIYRLQSENCVV